MPGYVFRKEKKRKKKGKKKEIKKMKIIKQHLIRDTCVPARLLIMIDKRYCNDNNIFHFKKKMEGKGRKIRMLEVRNLIKQ